MCSQPTILDQESKIAQMVWYDHVTLERSPVTFPLRPISTRNISDYKFPHINRTWGLHPTFLSTSTAHSPSPTETHTH